jgi:hypothetical protein
MACQRETVYVSKRYLSDVNETKGEREMGAVRWAYNQHVQAGVWVWRHCEKFEVYLHEQ